MNKKIIRITTVPMALKYLLRGQMRFMKENGFEVLMISAEGAEIEEIKEWEGCRHIIVPMTRKITPFRDLKCLFQLVKIFKREKPDIVHTHTPKAGFLGMLAAKYAGIKVRIHTVAGMPMMEEKGFKYWLLKWIEKLTFLSANHVWPNSLSLKQFISGNRLAAERKLKVIGNGSSNGIDTDRFNRATLDIQTLEKIKLSVNHLKDNQYLLYIGRLVADKGIKDLVLVFNELEKKYPHLHLILVGQYEAQFDPLPASIIEQIEVNSRISHINWSEKVEYYMAIADLFVFPSYREGFPNVLLQAGSTGLPVVCSNIGGNRDIIQNKVTGLTFEVKNRAALKDKIEIALTNSVMMNEMAQNLSIIIRTGFKREIIWHNILKEYQTLLNLENQ